MQSDKQTSIYTFCAVAKLQRKRIRYIQMTLNLAYKTVHIKSIT